MTSLEVKQLKYYLKENVGQLERQTLDFYRNCKDHYRSLPHDNESLATMKQGLERDCDEAITVSREMKKSLEQEGQEMISATQFESSRPGQWGSPARYRECSYFMVQACDAFEEMVQRAKDTISREWAGALHLQPQERERRKTENFREDSDKNNILYEWSMVVLEVIYKAKLAKAEYPFSDLKASDQSRLRDQYLRETRAR